MKSEAEFKRIFKKSVSAHKGFSMTLAAPMIVGIPDLYVVMPTYLPVLLEAKWLGQLPDKGFHRKVPFTGLQRNWISECHRVVKYSAMGLIGFKWKGTYYSALVECGSPLFDKFTDNFYSSCAWSLYEPTKKTFDIPALFAMVPIPKITTTPEATADDISSGLPRDTWGTAETMAV
jgi:hypothetical protein